MADKYSKFNTKASPLDTIKYAVSAVFLLVIICGVGVGIFFRVSEIEVTGLTRYTPEEIIKLSGIASGDSLYLVNESKIVNDITGQMPLIKYVQIIKSAPGKITIAITENQPTAYIKNGETYYLVDSSAKIIEKTESKPENIAEIKGAAAMSPKVGQKLTFGDGGITALSYLVELMQTAEKEGAIGDISEIDVSDTANIKFKYMTRLNVHFGTCDDCTEKMRLVVKVAQEIGKTEIGTITVLSKTEVRFIPETAE